MTEIKTCKNCYYKDPTGICDYASGCLTEIDVAAGSVSVPTHWRKCEETGSVDLHNDDRAISEQFEAKALKEIDKSKQHDMVNHPNHYMSKTGLEVIDVIEAFTSDLCGIEATDTGNVIKYICRWHDKNGLEDLKKAKWYLKHLIKHIEKTEKEK